MFRESLIIINPNECEIAETLPSLTLPRESLIIINPNECEVAETLIQMNAK